MHRFFLPSQTGLSLRKNLYFFLPGGAANTLTNVALDPVAKIPAYKVCGVRVEKAG